MLGNNRDYKTNDRRVRRNLQMLVDLTRTLGSEDKAAEYVLYPVKTLTPLAIRERRVGLGERHFVTYVIQTFHPELAKAARKAYRAAKTEVTNG